MKLKRLWAMVNARNREFFRDRSSFGWNLFFPFLIVVGFGIIFSEDNSNMYKVGVFPHPDIEINMESLNVPESFRETKHLKFIGFKSKEDGLDKLRKQRVDFLVQAGENPVYWVSESSPKSYIVEQMYRSSLLPYNIENQALKQEIKGIEYSYIDWLFPGVLAMNMMFSALWGVGYIMVRYRKNGVLKRLKATPLTALEYLSSQLLSRIFILMFSLVIVWAGCDLIFDFYIKGSYITIFLIYLVGGASLTSIGLLVASRGVSEEFTSGILNFFTWPMMFLSEVWFSLEGSPNWVIYLSKLLPLTHINNAVRRVMIDGANLIDVSKELIVLVIITSLCLAVGSKLFSWNK